MNEKRHAKRHRTLEISDRWSSTPSHRATKRSTGRPAKRCSTTSPGFSTAVRARLWIGERPKRLWPKKSLIYQIVLHLTLESKRHLLTLG